MIAQPGVGRDLRPCRCFVVPHGQRLPSRNSPQVARHRKLLGCE